jgi:hypothetical protein
VTAGRKGQATGVRDQLAARSQDEGNWAEEVSVTGFSLSCRLFDTCPGHVRPDFCGRVWRDSFRVVAELRERLVGVRWGRAGDGCPDPVPTRWQAYINRARWCGTGHPMLRTAVSSGNYCA